MKMDVLFYAFLMLFLQPSTSFSTARYLAVSWFKIFCEFLHTLPLSGLLISTLKSLSAPCYGGTLTRPLLPKSQNDPSLKNKIFPKIFGLYSFFLTQIISVRWFAVWFCSHFCQHSYSSSELWYLCKSDQLERDKAGNLR